MKYFCVCVRQPVINQQSEASLYFSIIFRAFFSINSKFAIFALKIITESKRLCDQYLVVRTIDVYSTWKYRLADLIDPDRFTPSNTRSKTTGECTTLSTNNDYCHNIDIILWEHSFTLFAVGDIDKRSLFQIDLLQTLLFCTVPDKDCFPNNPWWKRTFLCHTFESIFKIYL